MTLGNYKITNFHIERYLEVMYYRWVWKMVPGGR